MLGGMGVSEGSSFNCESENRGSLGLRLINPGFITAVRGSRDPFFRLKFWIDESKTVRMM